MSGKTTEHAQKAIDHLVRRMFKKPTPGREYDAKLMAHQIGTLVWQGNLLGLQLTKLDIGPRSKQTEPNETRNGLRLLIEWEEESHNEK